MQILNSPQRYGAVVQGLHWATVLLVIAAWLLGTFGDDLPKGAARDTGLFIHTSAGLAVLLIVVVRMLWRLADAPPPAEATPFGVWLDRAGQAAHVALYSLLVALTVAGIVALFARGKPLPLFGFGSIASPWAADRAFAHSVTEVHEFLANALLALAAVHAGAALVHHWVFRDRTLKRMLPGAIG
jgi:cytochrome b561